jgi:hypothetical protein
MDPFDARLQADKLRRYGMTINRMQVIRAVSPLEVGDKRRWHIMFKQGTPGYIVNPKWGTCLIWSTQNFLDPVGGIERPYYLVSFVRPTSEMDAPTKRAALSTPKVEMGDAYMVPGYVEVDGFAINYIVGLTHIVYKVEKIDDPHADNKMVIWIKSEDAIDEMTFDEFLAIMNQDPPTTLSLAYQQAYTCFVDTNPTFAFKNLLTTKVTVSDEAARLLAPPQPATSAGETETSTTTTTTTIDCSMSYTAPRRRRRIGLAVGNSGTPESGLVGADIFGTKPYGAK